MNKNCHRCVFGLVENGICLSCPNGEHFTPRLKNAKELKTEIIDFLENEEGYDKLEVISDIVSSIPELKDFCSDEISLMWDEKTIMNLDDFTLSFYNELIKRIINIVRSVE